MKIYDPQTKTFILRKDFTTLSKKLSGITVLFLIGYVCILSFFTCEPVPIPPLFPAHKQAIIESADRLILLQNVNGSWDWDITDQTGPTEITYRNISGVTAEGLLCAYQVTAEIKYLNAAKKTGDYLIAQMGNPIDITKSPNSANVLFLYNLYEASHDIQYLTEADLIMTNILYEDNYFAYNSGNHALDDSINGCTAGELFLAMETYRGSLSSKHGIVVWDLYQYIEAANRLNDTSSFADDLAGLIKIYVDQSDYITTTPAYILGLSAAVMGIEKAGLDNVFALSKLLEAQNTDGSWEDDNGVVQTSAYATMALVKAGSDAASGAGADYLLNLQISNGGWVEIDGKEYSEVDSEIIQALWAYMSL